MPMNVCGIYVCVTCTCLVSGRGQKRASYSLEVVDDCEPTRRCCKSGPSIMTHDHWAIFPAPYV